MIVTFLKLGISCPPDLHAKHILGMYLNQSIKMISGSVCEFISHFSTRNLKKWGQKLILGNNFINKNSDDFYVLQL